MELINFSSTIEIHFTSNNSFDRPRFYQIIHREVGSEHRDQIALNVQTNLREHYLKSYPFMAIGRKVGGGK